MTIEYIKNIALGREKRKKWKKKSFVGNLAFSQVHALEACPPKIHMFKYFPLVPQMYDLILKLWLFTDVIS